MSRAASAAGAVGAVLCLLCAAKLLEAATPAALPEHGGLEVARAPRFERVLLVSLDTTRRDRLGCYGGPARTPNLDRLASGGVVFERAVAPTPVTLPSHTSLFTGLYPPAHGVRDNARFRLGPEATTLAERFAAAGFRTAAFVSAFVLDAQFGLAQGFEVYEDRFQSGLGGMPGREERDAAATTEMALRWLDARGDSRWFVFLHYFDAHHPYTAPKPYQAPGVHPYDAELAYVDHELGRVLDRLRSRGLLEGTLVVVTADHGESLGEHGEATHGLFVYDSTLAVPLVFAGAGLAAGARSGGDVALVDVAPTLLELAGVGALAEIHGRSLVPALVPTVAPSGERGAPAGLSPTDVYAEAWTSAYSFGWSPLAALVRGGQKYILAPRPERYDLARDPREVQDLVADDPAIGAAMRAELERWYTTLSGDGRGPAIAVDLTDEERARLGALGYAAGAGEPARGAGDAGRDPKDGLAEFALMQRAGALHDGGDLAGALALYERILAENPRNAVVLERSGIALVNLGRTAEGIARLEAVDLFPGTSLFTLAQAYAQVGQAERTLPLIEDLRRRNPKFMPAHLFVAELHEGLGDRAAALEAYRVLLANWYGDAELRRRVERRIEALSGG